MPSGSGDGTRQTRSVLDAGGWRAVLDAPDEWGSRRPHAVPLALWELDDDGGIRGLIVGEDGRLVAAEDEPDFLGYCEPGGAIPQRYVREARRREEQRHLREVV